MRVMRVFSVLVVVGLLTAGCGGSNNEPSAAPTPFDYDASAPLRYQDRGVINSGYPITIHDVSFSSGGKQVQALLAVPPGEGPFPAVLYLHGSGGDRTQLLLQATWMAARGVVAMTITMPEGSLPANGTVAERLVA